MSARERSRQRAKRFIQELKQGTLSMNLTNADMAMFKWFVEERDRDTAHVTTERLIQHSTVAPAR